MEVQEKVKETTANKKITVKERNCHKQEELDNVSAFGDTPRPVSNLFIVLIPSSIVLFIFTILGKG